PPRAVVVLLLALHVEPEVVRVGRRQVDLEGLEVVVDERLVLEDAADDDPAIASGILLALLAGRHLFLNLLVVHLLLVVLGHVGLLGLLRLAAALDALVDAFLLLFLEPLGLLLGEGAGLLAGAGAPAPDTGGGAGLALPPELRLGLLVGAVVVQL